MAILLELAHLVDQHGMSDVQIGCGRVEPGLDDQRPILGEFLREIVLRQYFVGSPCEFGELEAVSALLSGMCIQVHDRCERVTGEL